MGKYHDLSGEKYGRLTVLKDIGVRKNKHWYLCRCDCGKVVEKAGEWLRSGNTLSCGCLKSDMVADKNYRHGFSKNPMYRVWATMKNRCTNPNDKGYYNYGGRGITICDKWLNGFEGFYEDMGSSYKPGLTIERIDVDGNYCPENCIWADRLAQANNTRHNRFETVEGITDTVANLARKYGLTYAIVQHRLYRGWSVEDAFKTPRQRKYKKPYKRDS